MSGSPSPAFERFQASRVMDYEKWQDGIGFDLTAIAEMTAAERRLVFQELQNATKTWREVEALEALQACQDEYSQDDAGKQAATLTTTLADALASDDRTTRLAAMEALHQASELPDYDAMLAREICGLTTITDGCVATLLQAETYPSDRVKQALLHASRNRTECAMHCAALLCYLCGRTESAFDFAWRPFFLKFAIHESEDTRSAAFQELSSITRLAYRETGEFLA